MLLKSEGAHGAERGLKIDDWKMEIVDWGMD
jgi:hypothetical protein